MYYIRFLLSFLVTASITLLPSIEARADTCVSDSYLYRMIDTNGAANDLLNVVLRRNSPQTREIIGGLFPFKEETAIEDGRWIATFYAPNVIFSLTKSSNHSSNYRNDETFFFKDGYAIKTKFDLLGLSSAGGKWIERDLLIEHETPPDEIILTLANFREIRTHYLDATLPIDASERDIAAANAADEILAAALSAASGAWELTGCFDNLK